jgi:polar amino acid transport system substrate-binding protein
MKWQRIIFPALSLGLFLALALFAATATVAELASDPRVADLVRAGKVRVALYPPLYSKDQATGELRGWSIDLVRALGARLGVEGVSIENSTPPEAVACIATNACDVGIMGIEPTRATQVDFTGPLVEVDYSFLVPAGSSLRNITDIDRTGIRVAAVRSHASTLALTRILKQAKLVYGETIDPAFDLLRNGNADVFASVREELLRYSTQLPGSRVLEDRYGANRIGMAVPKGQAGRLAYIGEFVEAAKASGLVQQVIDRAGWRGVQIAPPHTSN